MQTMTASVGIWMPSSQSCVTRSFITNQGTIIQIDVLYRLASAPDEKARDSASISTSWTHAKFIIEAS